MKKDLTLTGKGAVSLSQRMRNGLTEIRAQKSAIEQAADTVFVLDVSGSMNELVDDKTKIHHLREVMADYPAAEKTIFSTTVGTGSLPNRAGGSTAMHKAFKHLQMGRRFKKIVLISDGIPDAPDEALREAKALGQPINIIYIGPGGDEGEAFMKRLAAETGGQQATANTHKQEFSQQLTAQTKLLLTDSMRE